jgi:hypothetical protein
MEAAESRRAETGMARLSPEEMRRKQEVESLELSRTRVLHDLGLAANPRRREQLELALAHLDEKIRALAAPDPAKF